MDVQQNFHVPILSTGDAKTISDENQCCQNEVQTISGNSKSVKILEEFKRIYLERLHKIEEETPEEGAELKLKTLTSWINDLGEQNLMLVETVEQLEQEAADRVMLLEERLKKSSHIALEYLSKLEEYDNQLLNQANEKDQPMMLPIKTSNRLMQAQQTEEILKTRISNLQNDISGLLELIRRARYEGSWDTNGLSFLEVTYEDIFGLYPHQVSDNLESANHLQTTKSVSQQKVARALEDNILKDQGMKLQPGSSTCPSPAIGHSEKAEELQSSSYGSPKEEMEISTLNRKAEHTAAQLRRLIEENQRLIKENKFLSNNLKNKSDKIALLAQHLTEVDESLKRTKESMVAEVTEKNEQLLTVRQSMLRLEKYVIQADMQTHFKNAIIKEMRKDIKEAKSKLASQKRSQTACRHVDANKCEKISNLTSNLFVPCLCLPNRLHFQHSDQTCNQPIICCSDHIGGFLKPSFMVEKGTKRNSSISHNKKSQTHFSERKFSSLPNTSCRQCQNLNRVRGHISVKVPDDSNAPKQQEKKISLCNSCNRKFFE